MYINKINGINVDAAENEIFSSSILMDFSYWYQIFYAPLHLH